MSESGPEAQSFNNEVIIPTREVTVSTPLSPFIANGKGYVLEVNEPRLRRTALLSRGYYALDSSRFRLRSLTVEFGEKSGYETEVQYDAYPRYEGETVAVDLTLVHPKVFQFPERVAKSADEALRDEINSLYKLGLAEIKALNDASDDSGRKIQRANYLGIIAAILTFTHADKIPVLDDAHDSVKVMVSGFELVALHMGARIRDYKRFLKLRGNQPAVQKRRDRINNMDNFGYTGSTKDMFKTPVFTLLPDRYYD